jgi:hypothetical protein
MAPISNSNGLAAGGTEAGLDGVARKVAGELVGQDIARVRHLAVQSRDALAQASGYRPPLV